MKKQALLLLLLIGIQLACNLPGTAAPTATPVVVIVTATPAAPLPTDLPPATATITDTPQNTAVPTETVVAATATPLVPMVFPLDKPVNCRFGPGTEYLSVGALVLGGSAQILGKNSDGSWWQIANSSASDRCWVAASVTSTAGNLGGIPVAPAPAAYITGLTVQVSPKKVNVPTCVFPSGAVDFTATITVNGPLDVEWYWQTSQGSQYPPETTKFSQYGEKTVTLKYDVTEKGDFWVKLVVTKPKPMVAEAKYSVICEP